MERLKLMNIEKKYGKTKVLKNINLEIEVGKMVCLLGPSGCGKSTLLKIIAGLEDADGGSIEFKGQSWDFLSVKKRHVGMVFQQYSLFPNLNALQNVAFGLEMKKMPKKQAAAEAGKWLDKVGLQRFAAHYPYQLSGGQQQRVALARALAPSPDILLLDEPLSALDAAVRLSLRSEIRRIQLQLGITAVFVTHDQTEALAIADQVALMKDGTIVESNTPKKMYSEPKQLFTSSFIGVVSSFDGVISSVNPPAAQVFGSTFELPPLSEPVKIGTRIRINVHAGDVVLHSRQEDFTPRLNRVSGQVVNLNFLGETQRYKIKMQNGKRCFADIRVNEHRDFAMGETVEIALSPLKMHVYNLENEACIQSDPRETVSQIKEYARSRAERAPALERDII